MQLPAELASRIDALLESYDFKQLRAAAERISERYRSPERGPLLSNDLERAAYLAVRLPATFAAVSAVLEELKSRAGAFAPKTLLDLGAGVGTATFAARAQFHTVKAITLVEQDRAFVELGRRLAAGGPLQSGWVTEDLRSAAMPENDLAIAAYSLGELSASDAAKVIEKAWECTQVLCVVEPGTPRGYANIIRARDQLIAGGAHLVAPCPHERRCPMDVPSAKADSSNNGAPDAALKGRSSTGSFTDWCHFAARVERTSLHRRMKSGELGWEDEKFSYVIFSHDSAVARANARIVRHPQIGKGHIKLELCAQTGLELVTISKKQGEVYKRARRARWGDSWDI